MLSLNRDWNFSADKVLIHTSEAEESAQIKYKGLDFPSVTKEVKGGKTFVLGKQYGDKPGNEVLKALWSLKRQADSTLLTLIKQSATVLHNSYRRLLWGGRY